MITPTRAFIALAWPLALGCGGSALRNDGGGAGAGGAAGGSSPSEAGASADPAPGGTSRGGAAHGGSGPGTTAPPGTSGGSSPGGGAAAVCGCLSVPMVECGNGTPEAGETCDDGNTRSGDGCSSTCQVEAGFDCPIGESATCTRSCAGMTGTECQGVSCCASPPVPGGKFTYETRSVAVPDFRLDKFEVTVARYRKFQAAVDAGWLPEESSGAHPAMPESGWRSEWLQDPLPSLLFADGLSATVALGSSPPQHLYGGDAVYPVPGSDELAMNQVPWHIAFAFCIWDGGRLPADIELAYAGHGGPAQTSYAWGNSPSVSEMFADRPLPSLPAPFPPQDEPDFWSYVSIPVGSLHASVGKFGQEDLMSGLWEWVRDTGIADSNELIRLAGDESLDTMRAEHGGSWETPDGDFNARPTRGSGTLGFRCARDTLATVK